MTDRHQLTFSFQPCKAVVGDFQGGLITSHAGLLPIRQLDQALVSSAGRIPLSLVSCGSRGYCWQLDVGICLYLDMKERAVP